MDIATIGIRVDSSDLRRGEAELGRFTRAGQEAQGAVDGFERSTTSMGTQVRRAAGALVAAAGGMAAANRALASAEQYRGLQNGFMAMGQSADEAADTLQRIAQIANDTRAPLQATADLYRRVSTAAADLGASSEDVAAFTETVGMALAASGTSAEEASGALLQLSQAMAGGTVRAEEFNSILEGAYPIALAAARGIEEAGGSVGKLRQLVVAGEISSEEFMQAILSQQEQIRGAFEATTPTVAQAMQVLSNNFTMLIGGADSASGVTEALSRTIMALAENLDTVVPIVAAFGAVAGVIVAPVLALAAAGAAAASYLVINWDSLRERFPGVARAVDAAVSAMRTAFNVAKDVVADVVRAVSAALSGDWSAAWEAAKDVVRPIGEAIRNAAPEVIAAIADMVRDAGDTMSRLVNVLGRWARSAMTATVAAFSNLGALLVAEIGAAVDRVVASAAAWAERMSEVGSAMMGGLARGVLGGQGRVESAVRGMIGRVVGVSEEDLEIRSPSRVMERVGAFAAEGLAVGMESMIDEVAETAAEVAERIKQEMEDRLNAAKALGQDFVSGLVDGMSQGNIGQGLSGFLGQAQSAFMGTPAMQGIMGGIGAALGPAMPVIGAVTTALQLAKGFRKSEITGRDLVGTFGLGGYANTRTTRETSTFWGLRNRTSTSYDFAADETRELREMGAEMRRALAEAGRALGVSAADFRGVKVRFEGDMQAGAEAYGAALEAAIPGLERFRRAGETAEQAMTRLTGALETYNDAARVMMLPELPGTMQGAAAAERYLARAGGASAFGSNLGTVYGMMTPEQQLRLTRERHAAMVRELGFRGDPNNVDSATDLIGAMRRAQEAGNIGTYARLSQLAPLVQELESLRSARNEEAARRAADKEAARDARQAERDRKRAAALREAEQAAEQAARAEEDLRRQREALVREVAGYDGFATLTEERIARAIAGRGTAGSLGEVLEMLASTMRIVAANTARAADAQEDSLALQVAP